MSNQPTLSADPPPPISPPVIDYRQTPLGVMPRQLQRWLLLGIAVVMIAIMALSGNSTKPRSAATVPGATAVDPNQQRIEEYQRRIQEQAQRLAAEQVALQAAKDAAGVTAEPAAPATRPPTPTSRAADRTATPDRGEPEHVLRGDRSLFADSVAFTTTARSLAAASPTPMRPGESESPPAAPPVTPAPRVYQIPEGTIIETVLTNRLDGTYAGPVNCLVTTAVYAPDRQHLLIPAGARVLGEARAVTTFGQSRLAVTFHRILLPSGARVDLHAFHGLNQVGETGLRDQVDRHYAQIFGASAAVGAIAGLAQAQTSVGLDATAVDAYRQGAAANLAQSSARILDRFLNLLPTVTIREGHRIKVYLSSDLELPAYRDEPSTLHPGMPGGRS